MDELNPHTKIGVSGAANGVASEAPKNRRKRACEFLGRIGKGCWSVVSDIATEFYPVFRHAIVTALILLVLAGLHALTKLFESNSLTENIQRIDVFLYPVLYIYLGITTMVRLALSFLEELLPRLRGLVQKTDSPSDSRSIEKADSPVIQKSDSQLDETSLLGLKPEARRLLPEASTLMMDGQKTFSKHRGVEPNG